MDLAIQGLEYTKSDGTFERKMFFFSKRVLVPGEIRLNELKIENDKA